MSVIISMIIFSFVMSITPGPVNLIIISSGINNGFRRTNPFVLGATIGFTLLLAAIAFGLNQFIHGDLLRIISMAGTCFILYMGYKIISSQGTLALEEQPKAPRFYEGFLLQWLNPKAWLACVSGVAMFSMSQSSLWLFIGIYFFVCYICLSFWALASHKTSALLNLKANLKYLNIFMGALLIIVALYLGQKNLLG